jgi:serralysin
VPTVTIESSGSTSLVKVGANFFLDGVSSGSGPELQRGGAAVSAGGIWTPIGAEQTATGYDVAWKLNGANDYIVWATDSSGNFVSYVLPEMAGNNATLEALETTFHQDLNGDGTIGIPAGGSASHAAAPSLSAMMGGSGNDNFAFRADLGEALPSITANAGKLESHEPPSASDTNIAWLLIDAQHDHWQTVQAALGGPDVLGDHHHAAAISVHIADLHANHFIIH